MKAGAVADGLVPVTGLYALFKKELQEECEKLGVVLKEHTTMRERRDAITQLSTLRTQNRLTHRSRPQSQELHLQNAEKRCKNW